MTDPLPQRRGPAPTKHVDILWTAARLFAGQGVALGRRPLIDDLLRQRSLVAPFKESLVSPRGYVLIEFNGVPLGFEKNIGNRANNLYPAEWKVKSSHVPNEYN